MDINQTNDNELQKAIDDIANSEATPVDANAAMPDLESKIQDQMGTPPVPPMPPMPEQPVPAQPAPEAVPAPANEPEIGPESKLAPVAPETDIATVRTDIMRDLFPLMDKVEMTPERKWEIYRQMIDETHDNSMIGAAYDAVKGIGDDKERAEALLYLINLG